MKACKFMLKFIVEAKPVYHFSLCEFLNENTRDSIGDPQAPLLKQMTGNLYRLLLFNHFNENMIDRLNIELLRITEKEIMDILKKVDDEKMQKIMSNPIAQIREEERV